MKRSSSLLGLDLRNLRTGATYGAAAAALVGCQSILGINNDRPLVDAGSDGHVEADAGGSSDTGAPPGNDGGTSEDATADVFVPNDAPITPPDTGVDGGPTFANPLQVDVSSLLANNTIVTTATGGIALTPMDGTATDDNNDFPTQAFMAQIGESVTYGLPNDAVFPATSDTPTVKLAWNDSNNLSFNSLVVSSSSGTVYSFSVPHRTYHQVQLYATGAAGASTLNYTLHYDDGGQIGASLTLPDWCDQSKPLNGEFQLAYVERIENGTALDTANPNLVCHIYALNLNPDPNRPLDSVDFSDAVLSGGSNANLVFYGATAW